MSVKRNFLAGLGGSIWSALLRLAVVPLYLKFLGTEAFGLIGFFVTIQTLLQLLDLGMSPTLNREVARCSTTDSMGEARSLLHTLAVVYWTIAGIIALAVMLLAPVIAGHWLQAVHMSHASVTHAIMLMGLVVACRWPVGLYMGALMGLQKIAMTSAINAVMGTLSSLGAVTILAFVSPTIDAFFIWQACVGLIYVMYMRWIAWRLIASGKEPSRFSIKELKRVWLFSAGMTGVSVTGVVLMQLDKVLMSRLISLEAFGRYTLAAILANGLYILLTPLFNTIYPRMSALVASGETEKLIQLYRTSTRLFLAMLFPIAIAATMFSQDLIYLWTRNHELAVHSAMIASFFLIGTTLNGVMHFPYALQLAYGNTKLPLTINAVLIIIMVPVIIMLALSFGAVGGAAAWALTNCIYVFLGTWMTHRTLLKGIGVKWMMGDVGVPMCIATICVGLIGVLLHRYQVPMFETLITAGILVCISFVITIMISPNLRDFLQNGWFIKFR